MNDPDKVKVGVVVGTRLPGNVRTLLTNIQRLLDDHPVEFELELIVKDDVDTPDSFDHVDPGFDDAGRAVGTIRTLTEGVTSYARHHEIDLLFQVTKFPLHGGATAIAGRRTGTAVLTRFAGDNFREFQFSSGVNALKAFGLNNVVGRIPAHLSDRIIVLGPHGRSEIERRNYDVLVEEIPQPIDREKFSPVSDERERELAASLGFPTSEKILLTIGRLTKRKGIGALIETAKKLTERGELFRWYALGSGPMYNELDATPGVEPLGRVDFGEIIDYYRAADLVVHPSLIEGLPNVLLEAAACGTPTVARNVGDSETVASATFEEAADLPDLVVRDHDSVTLGDRFSPTTLRKQYADVIIATARDR